MVGTLDGGGGCWTLGWWEPWIVVEGVGFKSVWGHAGIVFVVSLSVWGHVLVCRKIS